MDLLALAKTLADRVEAKATEAKIPVAVCVTDTHGNVVLHHRMSGAPGFSIEISERKAYTSALVRMRTAEILGRGADHHREVHQFKKEKARRRIHWMLVSSILLYQVARGARSAPIVGSKGLLSRIAPASRPSDTDT